MLSHTREVKKPGLKPSLVGIMHITQNILSKRYFYCICPDCNCSIVRSLTKSNKLQSWPDNIKAAAKITK